MIKGKISCYIIFLCSMCNFLYAMHNSNRYLPFLERQNAHRLSQFGRWTPTLFLTSANGAGNEFRDRIGIPEIWGTYNLKNVINSLKEVTEKINNQTFVNPFVTELRPEWVDQDLIFNQKGRLDTRGFILDYEQRLLKGLSLGFWIPFMEITSQHKFNFNKTSSHLHMLIDSEIDQIDRVRRSVHDSLGLEAPDFSRTGFGDLDVYLRWNKQVDHRFLTRAIDINIKVGVTAPLGPKRRVSNPASIPFMGDEHMGLYFECNPEFELKQNWHLGLMFGFSTHERRKKSLRIPVGEEQFFYSALVGDLVVHPGSTFKISPYFTLANLSDGVDLHFRYTYIHHNRDRFNDFRPTGGKVALPSSLEQMKDLSRFRMGIFSFEVLYDSKDARKKWPLQPKIFASYDSPLWGQKNAVKHHQLTVGVELYF